MLQHAEIQMSATWIFAAASGGLQIRKVVCMLIGCRSGTSDQGLERGKGEHKNLWKWSKGSQVV
jgi:hypothetical protein